MLLWGIFYLVFSQVFFIVFPTLDKDSYNRADFLAQNMIEDLINLSRFDSQGEVLGLFERVRKAIELITNFPLISV